MSVQQDKFKEIADRIRAYLYTDDLIKPNDFAGKIDEVSSIGYQDGRAAGFNEGVDEGIVQGKVEAENEMFNYGMSLSEALTSGDSNIDGLEANINQAKSDITAIKTLIENHGVEVPVGTLSSTYDETLEQIITDEKDAGIEQGKQAAYDEFWDSYQDNGKMTFYDYAFSGTGWTTKTFRPKYDMNPTSIASMFANSQMAVDLVSYLESIGITLNCANVGNFTSAFYNSRFIRIGEIGTIKETISVSYVFYNCINLETIDKLRVTEGCTLSTNSFHECSALKNITIEGVIGNNIDFRYSPLSKESIMGKPITEEEFMELSDDVKANNVFIHNGSYYYGGVVTALSAVTSGKTLTLKKAAVSNAFRLYAKTLDVVGTISDTIGTENFDYVIAAGVYGEGVNVGEHILLHFDDVSVVLMKTGESIDVLSGLDEGQWELIEYGDGIEDEWGNLVASKSNWTINLV